MTLITVFSFLTMLARTLLRSRELISLSNKDQTVLGKPLYSQSNSSIFVSHLLRTNSINRFLLVGVPVGLHCRIGNLLAIDDKSLDVSPPPGDTASILLDSLVIPLEVAGSASTQQGFYIEETME